MTLIARLSQSTWFLYYTLSKWLGLVSVHHPTRSHIDARVSWDTCLACSSRARQAVARSDGPLTNYATSLPVCRITAIHRIHSSRTDELVTLVAIEGQGRFRGTSVWKVFFPSSGDARSVRITGLRVHGYLKF